MMRYSPKRWRQTGRPDRRAMVIAAVLAAVPGLAAAEEIYRTVGEDGVTSFTDFPVPGAQVLEVDAMPANAQSAQDSARLIEQQLEVAKALEESRLARRKAETERLAARAASAPDTIYYPVERDVGYWGWPGYGFRPGYPGLRPPHRPGLRPPYPGLRPPLRPGHRPPSISKPMPTRQ